MRVIHFIIQNYELDQLFTNTIISLSLFFFFRAALSAYRSSQVGFNQSYSCQPVSHPQQCRIWASYATYTRTHSNAGSLTHQARPGIEPTSSWILVRFITTWAMTGAPYIIFFYTFVRWGEGGTSFEFGSKLTIKVMCFCFRFCVVFCCTLGTWKLLGHGWNPSCSCDLYLSCSNIRSLTHWATVGTLKKACFFTPSVLPSLAPLSCSLLSISCHWKLVK